MTVFDRRLYAYGATALVLGAVLAPAFSRAPSDAYPLSAYPMFAFRQPRRTSVVRAVGVRDDGSEQALGPRALGTDEVLQAEAKLEDAASLGEAALDELCADLSVRVNGEAPGTFATVRIERVHFDALDYLRDAREGVRALDALAECRVAAATE